MNKKFSILLAFLLLSIYHIPGVKQNFNAQSFFNFLQQDDPLPVSNIVQDQYHRIQLALLLDTSSSMDGLIGQAKSQLWKMVNELAESTKDGKTPVIEIALYEYGNDNLSANQGYIRQVAPLTSDLDLISEKLFELRTQGGEEYCGYAIKTALDQLNWSTSDEQLKMLFIAGNEAFDQGPINFKTIAKEAVKKNVFINTVFCGEYKEGIKGNWKAGAERGKGRYLVINHNDVVEHIETPYDQEISELNQQLNGTYLSYGEEGNLKIERQTLQDSNASSFGYASTRSRVSFKAKESYNNAAWDVVDATTKDENFISKIEVEALPEVLQPLSISERKAYIKDLNSKRSKIKQTIRELDEKVKKYIAKEQKVKTEKATLDNVMLEVVKEQAERKNFEF